MCLDDYELFKASIWKTATAIMPKIYVLPVAVCP